MKAIIFIFISYGITSIVVEGSIFYPLIEKTKGLLHDLLSCHLCFGTWVGFILASILIMSGQLTPVGDYIELPFYLDIFANGMLSAGGVWFLHKLKE